MIDAQVEQPVPTEVLKYRNALRQAWSRGKLRYKLDPNQKKVWDLIESSEGGSFYFNKPRRVGGSYLLCLRAISKALSKPHAQIKYAAPTAKAVRKIIQPNFRKILEDCPEDLRPKWSTMEGEWKFPNGSIITVAGCDNQNYETLRGVEADEILVDEAGFIDDLRYILDDVLMPMTQDTEGKIIIASTPARSPSHESVKIYREHQKSGDFYTCTMWDNPRRSKEQHLRFLRKIARGMDVDEFQKTITFRREYMAEIVVDENFAVAKEWNDKVSKILVVAMERPAHCDRYVSLDWSGGGRDPHACLFGYYDWSWKRLVIEQEFVMRGSTIGQVAERIKSVEGVVWNGLPPPYLRIADNDLLNIHEISREHGLTFIPTAKDHKEIQVDNMNEWIRMQRLFIDPRCKGLIEQLFTTTWNKSFTSYERDANGHGDLIDCLVYLIRNVRQGHNPNYLNPWAGINPESQYITKRDYTRGTGATIKNLFKWRKQ